MEEANYDAIAQLEQSNWWYESRRELLERTLRPLAPFATALDVGCGVGANLALLGGFCREVRGIDLSPRAVAWCRRRGFHSVAPGDATALDLPDGSVDLVTCLDVLEHLDDRRAVAEIRRVLRAGGHLVATVPAHPHLWNENDDHSQHRRRYRATELARLLCDFEVRHLSYWNFSTYVPMLLYSAYQRLHRPRQPRNNLGRIPAVANRPLRFLLGCENRLRHRISFPTGTSLVAVARKPAR